MLLRFPKRKADYWRLAPAYAGSMVDGLAQRELFRAVETYCLFIGYPRSGHSLVGSILDAHPDVVISHELNVLGFMEAGFSRSQLFSLILSNSRQTAAAGRVETGYSYSVPGGWQGRLRTLRVIGDKQATDTGRRLLRRPQLLDRLARSVGVPMRILHVVRNPFDNITTMAKRSRRPLEKASAFYFQLCDCVAEVKRRSPPGSVLDVRHEALIADPRTTVRGLCDFLGIEAPEEFVEASARIVFPAPHQSRQDQEWSEALRAEVAGKMGDYPFLAGYTWGS